MAKRDDRFAMPDGSVYILRRPAAERALAFIAKLLPAPNRPPKQDDR